TTLVVAASTHRPYRLVSGQAMSQQWTADRGSTDLGSATELDTQAGWTVGTGTTAVTVHYAPQTSYRVAVVLSTLALAAAALVVVLDPGSRRRRRLPRSDVNRRVWLALFDAAVVVFAFGIGGLVQALVAVAALVACRRKWVPPRLIGIIALGAMVI